MTTVHFGAFYSQQSPVLNVTNVFKLGPNVRLFWSLSTLLFEALCAIIFWLLTAVLLFNSKSSMNRVLYANSSIAESTGEIKRRLYNEIVQQQVSKINKIPFYRQRPSVSIKPNKSRELILLTVLICFINCLSFPKMRNREPILHLLYRWLLVTSQSYYGVGASPQNYSSWGSLTEYSFPMS